MVYTVPTTQAVSYVVKHDVDWNTDVVENVKYLKSEADKLHDLTDSRPTRVYGNTYQNTSGKIRFVTIIVDIATNEKGDLSVYVEDNATPTELVARVSVDDTEANIDYASVSFCVPPGWYYKTDGDPYIIIDEWTEWELH